MLFRPIAEEEWKNLKPEERLELNHGHKFWKLAREVNPDKLDSINGDIQLHPGEELLSVRVINHSNRSDYYIYGISATLDGFLFQFLPGSDRETENIPKGMPRDFREKNRIIFEQQREYVRIIAASEPLGYVWEQQRVFEPTRAREVPRSFDLDSLKGVVSWGNYFVGLQTIDVAS
jgi:hypothetical protein